MGKRFIKFRVSRVIPTFQFCRSKDPSTLPSNPVPSFLRHKLNHPPPSPKTNQPFIKRHVSSSLLSSRWTSTRSRASTGSFPEDSRTGSSAPPFPFKWGKEPKWHVIAKIPECTYNSTPPRRKIYNSTDENDVILFPPLPVKSRRRRIRRRRTLSKVRISTSSENSGLFSEDDDVERENDDEDDDTDTLVSTDSSPHLRRGRRSKAANKRRSTRSPAKATGSTSPATTPARLSEFMRRMVPCTVVGEKVRESFAVVKRSEDPYEDFKRSMAEMVVEKNMVEERELEELLRCFLSLNSPHHHGVIVRAFSDIWEALICLIDRDRASTSTGVEE